MSLLLLLTLAIVQSVPADSAVLVLSNRPVMVFKAPLGALTPVERAEAAKARILRALETPDSAMMRGLPEGVLITLGDHPLFTITVADVDTARGITLEEHAGSVLSQVRVGITEEREARSLSGLLVALGLSAAATFLVMLALRLLAAVRRRLHHRVATLAGRSSGDLTLRGFTLVRRDQLLGAGRAAATTLLTAFGLVAGYVYVVFVLTRFPQTRQWGEVLGEYLLRSVASATGGIAAALPNVIGIAAILIVARVASRLVAGFFRAVESETIRFPGLHPDTADPSRRIAVALVWLFTLAAVYPLIPGSGTASFRAISVFAGLLITLGSSGVIGHAMSGLVVMYTRALRPGDYVVLGDEEGTVTHVGLLATKIRTPANLEVTVPSSLLLSGSIRNFSRLRDGAGTILQTTVTIGYDAPWRQVHEMLGQAAHRTVGFSGEPAPFVRQRALSDFYVEYQLNAYTLEPERRIELMSALHANIQDLFNEHGVQIMSPHFEADKDRPVVIPKERWFAPPAQG